MDAGVDANVNERTLDIKVPPLQHYNYPTGPSSRTCAIRSTQPLERVPRSLVGSLGEFNPVDSETHILEEHYNACRPSYPVTATLLHKRR